MAQLGLAQNWPNIFNPLTIRPRMSNFKIVLWLTAFTQSQFLVVTYTIVSGLEYVLLFLSSNKSLCAKFRLFLCVRVRMWKSRRHSVNCPSSLKRFSHNSWSHNIIITSAIISLPNVRDFEGNCSILYLPWTRSFVVFLVPGVVFWNIASSRMRKR